MSYPNTPAEKDQVEAAKDAMREAKAVADEIRREKILEAGGTVVIPRSKASAGIGMDGKLSGSGRR